MSWTPRTKLPTPATLMKRVLKGQEEVSATAGSQPPVTDSEGWGPQQVVASSNVAWIQYNYTDAQLRVGFHSGGVYAYANVPENIYEAMLATPSKGGFVARVLKKKFKAYRV